MHIIEPIFEIDSNGRVICKEHSRYVDFVKPRDYFQDLYLDVELTCKICSHYEFDECYFSKSRIDEIEKKRLKRKDFFCDLCGKKIERMLTIIHQLYNKEYYNIEMPLICCECYEKIEKNEFLSYSKKMIDFYLLNIVISIFFLVYFVYFITLFRIPLFTFYVLIIPLFIVICSLLAFIIFKSSQKLTFFIKGIKFYKKNFKDRESIKTN